jgi:hypothetical protein
MTGTPTISNWMLARFDRSEFDRVASSLRVAGRCARAPTTASHRHETLMPGDTVMRRLARRYALIFPIASPLPAGFCEFPTLRCGVSKSIACNCEHWSRARSRGLAQGTLVHRTNCRLAVPPTDARSRSQSRQACRQHSPQSDAHPASALAGSRTGYRAARAA